jgi:hypothetical protein
VAAPKTGFTDATEISSVMRPYLHEARITFPDLTQLNDLNCIEFLFLSCNSSEEDIEFRMGRWFWFVETTRTRVPFISCH